MSRAAEVIKMYRSNPVEFVKREFGVTPDMWQENALNAFISNDPLKQRISMQACAGPGKSTVMAWIGWLFLLCYAEKGNHPKAAAVSITGDNLRDNLWSEMSKWQDRSELLTAAFTWTQTRIFAKDHPNTWFMSARSFPKSANAEEVGRTLSGLHSKYVLYLIDESGDIPPSIVKSAEQGLSTGPEFGKIVQAGNPTSHSGMLYHTATKLRHNWHIIRITGDPDDPNRSPRISIEWARQQIKSFGRDNPWVKSYILGEFPESTLNTLLTLSDVEKSVEKGLREQDYSFSQKRLGVDVARSGSDKTVIFPRQGLRAFKPVVMIGAKTDEIAARVIEAKRKWGAEHISVDGTGGFGAGVVDFLKTCGVHANEIHFSGRPIDDQYLNKRAEMWFKMSEWVKGGGSLPDHNELIRELTSVQYSIVNGKLQLEPKEYVKKRLGYSPDFADAFCFRGDSLVTTNKGKVEIKDIKIGDKVLTPMGYFNVLKLWKTESVNICEVSFSNGKVIRATKNHKIFTWNRGWVELQHLSVLDTVEIDSIYSRILWRLRKLFIKECRFTFKAQVDTIVQEIKQTPGSVYCIDIFTPRNLVKYLKNIMFIIKTEIGKIMTLKTLNVLMAQNTKKITCLKDLMIKNLSRIIKKHLIRLDHLLPLGTGQTKVENGTQLMVKKLGKKEAKKTLFAQSVEKNIQSFLKQGQSFVQSLVSKNTVTKQTGLCRRVLSVAKSFLITNIANKAFADINAQTRVVSIKLDTEITDVYNLTVDMHNVYYVEGVLVANCLTFAFPDLPASMSAMFGNNSNVAKLKVEDE